MISTLVTGGTGLIGSEIVKALRKNIESVRVLSRRPKEIPPSRRSPGTEYVQGDIFDPASVKEAMRGCDALIIATQFENAPFENPSKGQTYMHVDAEGTEAQVAIAKELGIKRIIYISGAGTREGRTETWFQAKARAEKAVKESGDQWTIFRPSWVYGPGDRSLNKFAMFTRFLPFVPIIGTGKEKIQPIFVEDVAKIVAKSLNESKTFQQTYEMGGPEELTMKEIVKTMLRVMGKRRFIISQPKSFMKKIAAIVQFFPGRPLTPAGIDFITMEEKADTAALLKTFNPRITPLEEGLRSYLSPVEQPDVGDLRRRAA